jgi:hypothetical protein
MGGASQLWRKRDAHSYYSAGGTGGKQHKSKIKSGENGETAEGASQI